MGGEGLCLELSEILLISYAEECTWSPGVSCHLETPGSWAVEQKEQLETKGQVAKMKSRKQVHV